MCESASVRLLEVLVALCLMWSSLHHNVQADAQCFAGERVPL